MSQLTKPHRVVVTSNPLNHEGGVVNYYRIFLARFRDERVELVHHVFGSRMEDFYAKRMKVLLYPFHFVADGVRFAWRLLTDRSIRIVQVSPSFIPVPLLRDGAVLVMAKLTGRRTVVFYRGWKEYMVEWFQRHRVACRLFRAVFDRADVTLVLAQRFADDLKALGCDVSRVVVSSTMFEGEHLRPAVPPPDPATVRFLFLGRVSHLKGIHELIEAAGLLRDAGKSFHFRVVGHEDESGVLDRVRARLAELGLTDRFEFPGHLSGAAKFDAYANADVYVFPSWQEGCPTSVLEALGSGLFVVGTDVGALREILRDGENGRIIALRDAQDLARKLEWAVDHIDDIRARRPDIAREALQRYETKCILEQFRTIYHGLLPEAARSA